jgi:hypothetical protein
MPSCTERKLIYIPTPEEMLRREPIIEIDQQMSQAAGYACRVRVTREAIQALMPTEEEMLAGKRLEDRLWNVLVHVRSELGDQYLVDVRQSFNVKVGKSKLRLWVLGDDLTLYLGLSVPQTHQTR